jgi:hypothetical protein
MSIRGSIDSLGPTGASGWAYDSGQPGQPVTIQALLDGRVLGEAVAAENRPDLLAAGIGDGRCGFALEFHDALEPAILPFVSLRPRGGDVELPRTNLTGFGEFFRAVHARLPAAGRHRSVFGGLWTDRTDARRLLAGRVAAGATPAELEAILAGYVAEGWAVLRGATGAPGFGRDAAAAALALPSGRSLRQGAGAAAWALLDAVPEVLLKGTTLRLLCAVLDDQPAAFRVAPVRGPATGGFAQASTVEPLPSPAECVLLVAPLGTDPLARVRIEVVRGSHELPEFDAQGRSRFLFAGEGAGLELAREAGCSIDTIELGARDVALLGPGTLARVRPAAGVPALQAWCAPARVSPSRLLDEEPDEAPVLRPRAAQLETA